MPVTRPRDNQRQRLYDAESAAACAHSDSHWKQTIRNADLQGWVDGVLAKAPVYNRWPRRSITVKLSSNGGRYEWTWSGHEIRLGVSARNEWVVLHEIAHALTPPGFAPHGPEFAGIFAFLVRTVIGKAAHDALVASFRKHRVRKNTKAIPTPTVGRKTRDTERVKAKSSRTPSATELREAAAVIRQAAKAGLLGPGTAKPRVHALATARALEAATATGLRGVA